MNCRICGCSDLEDIVLYGNFHYIGDKFDYLKCKNCKCIQIRTFPKDMSVYYNSSYYSMSAKNIGKIYNYLEINSLKYNIYRKKFSLGWLINCIHKGENRSYLSNITKEDTILDIGCGKGHLLNNLAALGYKKLYGCDPFVDNDILLKEIKIYKATVNNFNSIVSGSMKFKLIMFNHSLEHVENPLDSLIAAKDLLDENGILIISLPVLNDFYWNKYGKDLYILDPPLHFFTVYDDSIKILLKKAGLELQDVTWYEEPTAELIMKRKKAGIDKEIVLKDHIICSIKSIFKNKEYLKYSIGFNGTYICKKN